MAGYVVGEDGKRRCVWGAEPEIYRRYHDQEWGRPVTEDHLLFEKLCLEGFQAGLSWLTILRKRPAFRAAFAGFDPDEVARFTNADVGRLLADTGIVRHEGKIRSTINNAARAVEMRREFGSLAEFFWSPAPPEPDPPSDLSEIPASTEASKALARTLKKRGWTFVGPTTVYAFMQAMGIVNDHVAACFVRAQVDVARRKTLSRFR